MCHSHLRDPDARSKLHSMKDQELITYCQSIHVSMDSADLIDELIYRFEFYKEVSNDSNAEEN